MCDEQFNTGKEKIIPDFLPQHEGNPIPEEKSFDEGEIGLFARNIGGDDLVHDEGKLEERLMNVPYTYPESQTRRKKPRHGDLFARLQFITCCGTISL